MANKCMKKCSTSLAIKQNANQSNIEIHFTLVRVAFIKQITNAGEDAEAGGNLTPCCANVYVSAAAIVHIKTPHSAALLLLNYSEAFIPRNVSPHIIKISTQ
jgi:hypothetical protein